MAVERFTVYRQPSEVARYGVSIPNFDGGEVVRAEDHDAEVARLRQQNKEHAERRDREVAGYQRRVMRTDHLMAEARRRMEHARVDHARVVWTDDPPSQRPGGWWRYISVNDIYEVAVLVQEIEELRALNQGLARHDPPDRAYDLRQRLDRAVRWLREAEDIARTEMPTWLTAADRIRDIYEQITDNVLNGRRGVPPLKQRLREAEDRAADREMYREERNRAEERLREAEDWGKQRSADALQMQGELEAAKQALAKPLRETILAVLRQMPSEAAPEHLATQIESQVRAWQAIP